MHKKRILIIDDDPSITKLIKLSLKKKGFAVREENRPSQGLASAREFHPDLILLDVFMPEIDGGELASQIKTDESLKNTKIVFLSAAVLEEETDAPGDLIGGHPFISKQSNINDILSCIEENLR